MTARRSGVIAWCPNERAGDDSSDTPGTLTNLSCDPAIFVQLLYRNNVFMCCNLQDAVCGGIYDQRAGPLMFLTEVTDNVQVPE